MASKRVDTDSPDYQEVTFTVANCVPIQTRSVFALVDVEMLVGGVGFWIRGVQARHLAGGGTSIHLPTYRTPTGSWRAAIELPTELVEALSQAVLDHLVEIGVAVLKVG
jgi:hypothetical protein